MNRVESCARFCERNAPDHAIFLQVNKQAQFLELAEIQFQKSIGLALFRYTQWPITRIENFQLEVYLYVHRFEQYNT